MGHFFQRPLTHAAPLVLLLSFSPLSPVFPDQNQAPEFRVLELERELKARPLDLAKPETRNRLFALGEARFDSRLRSADTFKQLERSALNEPADWLALVYRLKEEPENAAGLEGRLRDALADRSFFKVFENNREWSWRSPLDHRFEFRETVDRLEIYRDEALFFALQLG